MSYDDNFTDQELTLRFDIAVMLGETINAVLLDRISTWLI